MIYLKYIFPEVKFDTDPRQQMHKVLEELLEADKELHNGNYDKFLEEVLDMMHASANILYKMGYSERVIDDKIQSIQLKNQLRGYYK